VIDNPRTFLSNLFFEAVRAADPYVALKDRLPQRPKGKTVVVAYGKAASQMARAFERLWDGPFEGVAVTRHGAFEPCDTIRVLQSAHPVPDENGLLASNALLQAVSGLTADDLVIALVSGGGSALLPAPAEGLSFDDEVLVNRLLLESGAPIAAMNVVRKHFSRIKGGKLAQAAFPARLVSFIISDVPGDNPAMVSSGPTVSDAATVSDVFDIVEDYRIPLPAHLRHHLTSPHSACPKPDDPGFARCTHHIIASARHSLAAVRQKAETLGVRTVILSDQIEGEARDIGQMHAALVREIALYDSSFQRPVLLISGGETTVTLHDGAFGKGGRNSEFLLSLALGIEGLDNIHALAADTDGIDGSETNAGAFADGTSISRLRHMGGDARRFLSGHDAWSAFHRLDDLFVTGPTGTNINDLRMMLIAV
jgi:hydroxypyruvate reductase